MLKLQTSRTLARYRWRVGVVWTAPEHVLPRTSTLFGRGRNPCRVDDDGLDIDLAVDTKKAWKDDNFGFSIGPDTSRLPPLCGDDAGSPWASHRALELVYTYCPVLYAKMSDSNASMELDSGDAMWTRKGGTTNITTIQGPSFLCQKVNIPRDTCQANQVIIGRLQCGNSRCRRGRTPSSLLRYKPKSIACIRLTMMFSERPLEMDTTRCLPSMFLKSWMSIPERASMSEHL